MPRGLTSLSVLLVLGCTPPSDDPAVAPTDPGAGQTDAPAATDAAQPTDATDPTDVPPIDTADWGPGDPFADAVVSFTPGEGAGFGADAMPDVVLGAPLGRCGQGGSLDVVSLGEGGVIVLAFEDAPIVDGPGPDLIVFENGFEGFLELARVEVSDDDGETWHAFPCDAEAEGFPGCAGVGFPCGNPERGVDPTDPTVAGGDAYDLADLDLDGATWVRITDLGGPPNTYEGPGGGFDLDAVARVTHPSD